MCSNTCCWPRETCTKNPSVRLRSKPAQHRPPNPGTEASCVWFRVDVVLLHLSWSLVASGRLRADVVLLQIFRECGGFRVWGGRCSLFLLRVSASPLCSRPPPAKIGDVEPIRQKEIQIRGPPPPSGRWRPGARPGPEISRWLKPARTAWFDVYAAHRRERR